MAAKKSHRFSTATHLCGGCGVHRADARDTVCDPQPCGDVFRLDHRERNGLNARKETKRYQGPGKGTKWYAMTKDTRVVYPVIVRGRTAVDVGVGSEIVERKRVPIIRSYSTDDVIVFWA